MLCPGSRSGPLATAAGLLADQGALELTTALDERSAAFLALGLATASGRAVAVVTTSGTAVANLLPAAVEADRSTQPLLLLTADRPSRLKDCGANQTVNQEDFLRPACRWTGSAAPGGIHTQSQTELQDLAKQTWGLAHSPTPGPVHLNLPLEEPLHASATDQTALRDALRPFDAVVPPAPVFIAPEFVPSLDPSRPGVVVAGPWRGLTSQLTAYQKAMGQWLEASGWHLLADPLSALPINLPGRIHHWELQLDRIPSPNDLQVLRTGPLPASRRLERWLSAIGGQQVLISEGEQRGLDPLGSALQWSGGLAAWLSHQPLSRSAAGSSLLFDDHAIADALVRRLPLQGAVTEPGLALQLAALLPPGLPLMLAASSPVRDWMTWSGPSGADRPCFSFRGASGIDGTLSLAMGLALELGPTVLLTGDLALLHDSNGWLHADRTAPPLLVLVIDNNGGGIFQQLPIESSLEPAFDRLFAMPQAVDLHVLAAAHGVPGRSIAALEDLPQALEWGLSQQGTALLRVCTDRRADAALRSALRAAAQNAGPPL